MAGLLGAAGPKLAQLEISKGAAVAAVRLMAGQAYPWLPAVKELSLVGFIDQYGRLAQGWGPDMPALIGSALTQLPALESLKLGCPSDEVLLRLLALADSGDGLPKLSRVAIDGDLTRVSDGAILLLLLWLKRNLKQAVQEEGGRTAKWTITSTARVVKQMPKPIGALLTGIENAWALLDV